MPDNKENKTYFPMNALKKTIINPGDTIDLSSTNDGWFVKKGNLKVFLSNSKNIKDKSRRIFLFNLGTDKYFYGLNDKNKNISFFVTPTIPTVLLKFSNESVFNDKKYKDHKIQHLKNNHDWLSKINVKILGELSSELKYDIIKSYDDNLQKGSIIKENDKNLSIIDELSGNWKYCSKNIICSETPFLNLDKAWIEAEDDNCGYKTCDVINTLSDELITTALKNNCKYINLVAEKFLQNRIIYEKEKLTTKSVNSKIDFSESLKGLSNILEKDSRMFIEDHSLDPLKKCISLVGEHSLIKINFKSYDFNPDKNNYDLLNDIAKAYKFRIRKVILRDEWWKKDNGPLIAFIGDNKTPIALIPYKEKSYKVYDSISDKTKLLDQEVLDSITPIAYSFIRGFEDVISSPIEIWRFGIQGLNKEAIKIFIIAIAVQLLNLSVPIFTGKFMDMIIPQSDRVQWLHFTVILIIVGISTSLFNFVQSIAILRLESKMNVTIQSATMDRLLKLPLKFFRNYTIGDLADRVLGVNEIRQLISGITLKSVLSGITGFISFFLLLIYSPKLSIIAIIFSVIAGLINFMLAKKALRYNRKIFFIRGKINGLLLQFLNGISRLHVSATESKAFTIWAGLYKKQKKWDFKAKQIENFISVTQIVYPLLSTLLIFITYVFWLLPNGNILTIGSFIAFTVAFSNFLNGYLSMVMAFVESLEIIPLYERVKPIFDEKPESLRGSNDPKTLMGNIEFSNVTFRYDRNSPNIMQNINLSFKPREYVAIVGPSGSGKSTLLRLLLGFEEPNSGSIYYDGKDLQKLDIEKVRSQIGVVLQTSQLISGSIYNNIVGSSNKYSLEDAWDAVELAGLKNDIKAMPMGMHTIVNQGGTTFSGGQRQRLMIARAILAKPKILLFDEATSALDNKTQSIVKDSIDSINATKIVIAHRLSTIIDADKIIVIANGGIEEQGTYDELITKNGLFFDLAKRQLA